VASLGELTLFISAESNQAVKNIQQVSKLADQATLDRKLNINTNATQVARDLGQISTASDRVGQSASVTSQQLKNLGASFDAQRIAKEFIFLDDKIQEAGRSVDKLRKTLDTVGLGGINKAVDSAALTLTARFKPELLEEQIRKGVVDGVSAGADTTKRILYKNFFSGVSEGVRDGVNTLAKIGFAGQGLLFIVEPIKAAFKGLFDFTIGQNIQLRDTILATQTTLATTLDVVGNNGQKITDPFEKIVALEKPVNDAIESIRIRSLKLAGVTSSQVIDVFSVVATNVGQINGDLKDAENLAIAFTAALGTLGIPLFQARQEIGSILGGYITEDSLLAKRLGITNKDIQKAKTDVGGVTKFLLDKLKTAEAGQAILAQGFRGVTSNIQELFELVGLALGKPLVDPLVAGLNKAFQILYTFKTLLVDVGTIVAKTFNSFFSTLFAPFMGGSFVSSIKGQFEQFTAPLRQLLEQEEGGQAVGGLLENALLGRNPDKVPKVINGLVSTIREFRNELKAAAEEAGGPLARLLGSDRAEGFSPLRIPSLPLGDPTVFNKGWDTLRSTIEELGKGVLALAQAFAKFKIREFADTLRLTAEVIRLVGNAFLGAANLAASFFQALSGILSLPVVEYLNQIRIATKLIGISDLVDNLKILVLGFVGIKNILATVQTTFTAFQAGLKGIAIASQTLQVPLGAMTTALAGMSFTGRAFATAGDVVGRTIDKLGTALGYTAEQLQGFKHDLTSIDGVTKTVKSSMRGLIGQMIGVNLAFAAFSLGLGIVITAISNFYEEQRKAREEAASLNKALNTSTNELLKLAQSADKIDESKFSMKIQLMRSELEKLIEKGEETAKALQETEKTLARIKAQKAEEKGNPLAAAVRILMPDLDQAEADVDKALGTRQKTLRQQKTTAEAQAQILADKIAFAERVERQKEEGKLLAQQRKGIEEDVAKQRKELAKQVADKEFSMRMELERETLRFTKERSTFQIDQAKKAADALIDGQTGAGAEAIRALNEYISTRDKADVERQINEKEFELTIQEMDKELGDFKLQIAEKIAEIQKRVGKFQMQVADYQVQKAIDAANAANGAGNGNPTPGAPTGTGNSDKVVRFFMAKGLPKISAAALAGGMMQESGLKADAINPTSGAEGIAQWNDSRKQDMINAGARNSFDKQLEFMWKELMTTESEAMSALKAAKTLNQALLAAAKFERFDGYKKIGSGTEWGDRVGYTKGILAGASLGGQQVGPGTMTGGMGIQTKIINDAVKATQGLTGVNNQCAEAVKRFMKVMGVNASVMDKSAVSAEKMGMVMTDFSQLRPGDIVARGQRGKPEHVGVYTGGSNVFHQSATRGLQAGNYADLGYFKQKGYFIRPGTQSQVGDVGTGTAEKPQLDLSGIDLKADTSGLDAISQKMKEVKQRFVELKAEMLQADTAEKMKTVVRKIFGAVDLTGLREQEASLRSQRDIVSDITDPEKYQILIDLKGKEGAKEEALKIYREDALEKFKQGKLTQEQMNEIEQEITKEKAKFLADLERERELRERILNIQRQAAMIPQMKADMAASALGFNQEVAKRRAGMQVGLFYDPRQQRMAEAEGAIESYRLGITKNDTVEMGPAQQEEFNKYKDQQLLQAQQLGELDAIEKKMAMLKETASGIGQAMSNAITFGVRDIITGAKTVNEVLGDMFKSIGDSFIQMAAKIIQEMIAMLIYKTLLGIFMPGAGPGSAGGGGLGDLFGGLFGGGKAASGGGTGGAGGLFGGGLDLGGALGIGSASGGGFSLPGPDSGFMKLPHIKSANGNILVGGFQAFAKGGIANRPTLGLVGEGAYNEAIVPLPNGKAIPVDMKGSAGGAITTNITVNVDQNGQTQSELTGDKAGKLGKALDAAVKRVILEEKRAGGILSGR